MNFSWIALLLTLSFSCLIASYFIIPRVSIAESELNATIDEGLFSEPDTLTLPSFTGDFKRLTPEAGVKAGDTLGLILKDRFADLRDSLSAFAKTGTTNANLHLVPSPYKEELLGFLPKKTDISEEPTPAVRLSLRGFERDYLASEIMGAEDASTEIIGKLSHLADAGKSESSTFKMLESQLRTKQAFIARSNKRLMEKEVYIISSPQSKLAKYPVLTEEQRNRILNISIELPIDTQCVFAPIEGRYFQPDNDIGYIISTRPLRSATSAKDVKQARSSYTLEAEGHPILWGTAQRKDGQLQNVSSNSNSVKVIVK